MPVETADYVVIGAGMVGITIAQAIKARAPEARVVILEKEPEPGRHSSGRNSGVLHSGIYYPPASLKAQLCGAGARAWMAYCEERGLALSRLGKILVPAREEDGAQLDLLEARGPENGVAVERLDAAQLRALEPDVRSATGDALLVRQTSVVSSSEVLASVVGDAKAAGIEFRCGGTLGRVDADARTLEWAGGTIAYGHCVNAAGLHADSVAHRFGVGADYTLLPFKGIYYKLDPASGIRVNHLIYPVPDLRVPFLGVHTTTAIDGTVYVGPTALPALGRENYRGLEGTSPGELLRIGRLLAAQYVAGRDGFRRLAWQEGKRFLKPYFAEAARALLPRLAARHLLACEKVGIRAQMLDRKRGTLVTDFAIEAGPHSTHVLNAISPAFTSAIPFAGHVCNHHIFS